MYYETACSFLRHPREAPYLFSRVKDSIESLEDPKIPSWVPRWDRPVEFSISRPHFWYSAGGVGDFRLDIRRDRTLAIQGIILGYTVFTSRNIQKHNIGKDPDAWGEEYRVTRKPFIDILWEETLHAAKPATTQFEKEFAWTLVRAYPATPGEICDTQHMAEFTASPSRWIRRQIRGIPRERSKIRPRPGSFPAKNQMAPVPSLEETCSGSSWGMPDSSSRRELAPAPHPLRS